MSLPRERRMLRMTPLSSRYWMMKACEAVFPGVAEFPAFDGVVFDDVRLGFHLAAVEQELVRVLQGVVEIVEDDVLEGDAGTVCS